MDTRDLAFWHQIHSKHLLIFLFLAVLVMSALVASCFDIFLMESLYKYTVVINI